MSALGDLGPTTPGRMDIHLKAREVEALARLARELTIAGPRCDPARAQRQLNKVRALLGPMPESEFQPDHLEQGAGAVPDLPERI